LYVYLTPFWFVLQGRYTWCLSYTIIVDLQHSKHGSFTCQTFIPQISHTTTTSVINICSCRLKCIKLKGSCYWKFMEHRYKHLKSNWLGQVVIYLYIWLFFRMSWYVSELKLWQFLYLWFPQSFQHSVKKVPALLKHLQFTTVILTAQQIICTSNWYKIIIHYNYSYFYTNLWLLWRWVQALSSRM
jgi:hypothetical protein